MRKLIYSLSISLDGFAETTERSLDWVFVDEELHTIFNDESRQLGAFLYGRRIYELMASYWPTADSLPDSTASERDFSRIWKAMPKIVFSKTLDRVDWNSRLVRTDAVEEVRRLKAEEGGDLGVGGPTLAGTLIRSGLVDEFRLYLNPVVLGSGTPFFPPLERPISLRLMETRRFRSGVIFLRYERD